MIQLSTFRLKYGFPLRGLLFAGLLVQIIPCNAQQSYDSLWNKVSLAQENNLIQTAWNQVRVISQRAKTENNQPQEIKSLLYEMKYRDQIRMGSFVKNIESLKANIASIGTPGRQILESILAQMYADYLESHLGQLDPFLRFNPAHPQDWRTWDITRFYHNIRHLFLFSLDDPQLLKNTPMGSFAPILMAGKNTSGLRPTLYDLLAHRALHFFTSQAMEADQPSLPVEFSYPQLFGLPEIFATYPFPISDSNSLEEQAMILFQQLEKFHLADANPGALLEVTLQRLQFIRKEYCGPHAETLYHQALEKLLHHYSHANATAQVNYFLAEWFAQRGHQFDPVNLPIHQFDLDSAKEICIRTIREYPQSRGAVSCRNLLKDLSRQDIELQTEQVNLPHLPFRTLVTYQGCHHIYFRLFSIVQHFQPGITTSVSKPFWPSLLNQPLLRSWDLLFPDPGDGQPHAAEIKIGALPPGHYLLIASSRKSFPLKDAVLAQEVFSVSRLSDAGTSDGNFFVLDRLSGEPIKGVRIQAWKNQYDAGSSSYIQEAAGKYISDEFGHFRLSPSQGYQNLRLDFSDHGDSLCEVPVFLTPGKGKEPPKAKTQTFFYTDRSIYRPGQSLFFKGVVLQKNGDSLRKWRVLPDFETSVRLYDANGQQVDSIKVVTNSFGSYQGTFQLPTGKLKGSMFLEDRSTQGRVYFSVEDYRRPDFLVALNKPNYSYRLNDSVTVSGQAIAYAGNALNGVQVKYRIEREVRWPFYGRMGRPPFPFSPPALIAQGRTMTDSKGQFHIKFLALDDPSFKGSGNGVFYFIISSRVTDINGESQSGNLTLPVGRKPLLLSLEIPAQLQG
ncbi:MAG: MG2 domain-containing protein, partial [Chitinophagaceae bacterium]